MQSAEPAQGTAPSGLSVGDDPRHVLRLDDVHVRLSGSHILQGVSFDVRPGRVTALLGRNGVGKTTCVKAVMGLVPRTGHIELDGRAIGRELTHKIVRSGVGYVPEDREVFRGLTVEENLRLAVRPGTDPDFDRVHNLFPELKQRRKQLAGSLSGGQQQMVALGRVLLRDTRLLLVDEPTKGLAPKVVAEVGEALVRVADTTTILLVEQNLGLVRKIATDAIALDTGRVVYTGTASELLDDAEVTNNLLGVAASGRAGA